MTIDIWINDRLWQVGLEKNIRGAIDTLLSFLQLWSKEFHRCVLLLHLQTQTSIGQCPIRMSFLSGYNVLAGPFIEWNCCQVARWAPHRCSPPPRHCPRPPCSRPCLSWGVRIWQMLLNIGRMLNVEERKVFTGKIMSKDTYDYDERRLWLWWRWWMMILMMMIMLPAVLEPAAACVVYCPTLVLQAITKPESVQHLISFKFNFRHSFSIWLPAELGIWCN